MKKYLFIFLSLVLGAFFFVFALRKFGWQEVWRAANILSWWQFLVVLLLILAGFLVSVWHWKVVIKSQTSESVSFWSALKARSVGFAMCYLTPSVYFGGEAMQAIILNSESKISWTHNIFSIIVDKAIDMTVGMLVMIFGLIYIFVYFSLPVWLNWTIGAVVAIWIGFAYFFYSRAFRQQGFITSIIKFFWLDRVKKVDKFSENIQEVEQLISDFFLHKPGYFASVVVLAFFRRFFILSGFWLTIHFLKVQVNVFQVLGFMAVTSVMYFLPVPGSLGIHEAAHAIFFNLFGLGGYNGVAFTLILRVLELMGMAVGLFFLLIFQIKVWKNNFWSKLKKIGRKLSS